MFISEVFGKRIETATVPLQQFILNLGDYLNVTPKVMDYHYNRASKYEENKAVQHTLLNNMLIKLNDTYKQSLEYTDSWDIRDSNIPEYSGSKITRLMRETTDDAKWNDIHTKYLLAKEVSTNIRKRKWSVFQSEEEEEVDNELVQNKIRIQSSTLINTNSIVCDGGDGEDTDGTTSSEEEELLSDNSLNNFIVSDSDEVKEEEKDAEKEYVVEGILRKKFDLQSRQILYLVKWKGFSKKDSTWEPLECLDKCLDLVTAFEIRKHKLAKKRKSKSKWKSDDSSDGSAAATVTTKRN